MTDSASASCENIDGVAPEEKVSVDGSRARVADEFSRRVTDTPIERTRRTERGSSAGSGPDRPRSYYDSLDVIADATVECLFRLLGSSTCPAR